MFGSLQKILLVIIFLILFFLLLVNIVFYIFQRVFIYFPSGEIVQTPSALDLEYNDILLKTHDFLIHGWEIPNHDRLGYLLYFNGNAGNIGTRLDIYKLHNDLGLHVFTFDYPGYGKSSGSPSMANIVDSLEHISDFLCNKIDNDKPLIIHGFSLGGAVAVLYASKYPSDGLILESTFTSLNDLARVHYPYLFSTLINRENYNSLELIQNLKMPKLIIHSKNDEIIPYWMGEQLYETSPDPKLFAEIDGGHNTHVFQNRPVLIDSIQQLIDKCTVKH